MILSMNWPAGEGQETNPKGLDSTARTILIVWTVLVVGLAGIGVFTSRDLDGWEGLVAAIYIAFALVSVVAIGVTALLIRSVAKTRNSQILAAVLGPPLVGAIIFVVLMALG